MTTQTKSLETLRAELSRLLAPFDGRNPYMDEYLEFYDDLLGSLPDGALKRLFVYYSGYEPNESHFCEWWELYHAYQAGRKAKQTERPSLKRWRGNAILFMWATRATHRMEF